MKFIKIHCLIVSSLLVCISCLNLGAQSEPDKPLPVDPNVRIGKLENGLTYYIRKNNKPEKRVEFRLAVNAGLSLRMKTKGIGSFCRTHGL